MHARVNIARLHGQFEIKILTRAVRCRRNVSRPHIARPPPLQPLCRARALSLPWQEIRKNNHHHRRNAVHALRLRPKYIKNKVQKKTLLFTGSQICFNAGSHTAAAARAAEPELPNSNRRISGSCTPLHTHTQLRIISPQSNRGLSRTHRRAEADEAR